MRSTIFKSFLGVLAIILVAGVTFTVRSADHSPQAMELANALQESQNAESAYQAAQAEQFLLQADELLEAKEGDGDSLVNCSWFANQCNSWINQCNWCLNNTSGTCLCECCKANAYCDSYYQCTTL